MQDARRRRLIVLVGAVLTVALAVAGSVTGAGSARAQTTGAWAPSAAKPYSDPRWLPLRDPAAISCTYSNCPGPYHGYWAIDFLGQRGDPVYAAGAGVFHIGAIDTSCKSASSPDAPGTWVWIDHGGGLVSRYHHLDAVLAHEGQLVTPATEIGLMGHSGDFAPCTTNYLHFEVRHGGVKGTRVDPGQLWGCQGAQRVSYPAALGYASWNSLPKATKWTPQLSNGCLPSSTGTASAPSAVSGARGNASARVSWSLPLTSGSSVTAYLVSQQLWSPSLSAWNSPTYRAVTAGTRTTTMTGLTNGRLYRYAVLARNAAGNSAWTRSVQVVPATVPSIPATNRGLAASSTLVRFAWWKSTAHGTPVTSYKLAIRRETATGWKSWAYVTVPASTLSYKFTGLRQGATYEVTVRANSSAGHSRFGTYRKITTSRS